MLPECAKVVEPIWSSLPKTTSPLFATVPRTRTLNKDLQRAGLEKIDAEGRCLDFHSLRYFFCVELSKRLPIVMVQRLMRHRDIRQTANLYAALGVADLGEEVWNLPEIGLCPIQTATTTPATVETSAAGAQTEPAPMSAVAVAN
jgi:integrase